MIDTALRVIGLIAVGGVALAIASIGGLVAFVCVQFVRSERRATKTLGDAVVAAAKVDKRGKEPL